MSQIDDGGPAFSITSDYLGHHFGMTLRDWFAGQALQAAWEAFNEGRYDGDTKDIARCAYQQADAMLVVRAEGPSAAPVVENVERGRMVS